MKRSRPHKFHDDADHRHQHGAIDPKITSTKRGKWAVKWTFALLMATALLQVIVVAFSGSVALLADTLHNFGDAFTALPLWIAFSLARRKPTRRFTYGLGRLEDLAGVFIVLVILASAAAAGYESVVRFFDPRPVKLVWVVAAAALIGFAGNEWVARLRIKVGQEIKSAALEADGRHARIDGLTSLSVLFGALGSRLGYPLVDPVVGMLITLDSAYCLGYRQERFDAVARRGRPGAGRQNRIGGEAYRWRRRHQRSARALDRPPASGRDQSGGQGRLVGCRRP